MIKNPNTLLREVRKRFTQNEIAQELGVSPRTIKRWEAGSFPTKKYTLEALAQLLCPNNSQPEQDGDFTFIDLFAGIGGCRMGFESAGGKCVYTNEWDSYSIKTYMENFSNDHWIDDSDISKVPEQNIPDHDVLVAGFPCQPFSIAGVSKKNSLGKKHGFKCKSQGTLFFDVERIIREKRPKAIMLENVKNLIGHDKKRTFKTILDILENDLEYKIYFKVIDAKYFVPQHRERLIIVGFREPVDFSWEDLILPSNNFPTIRNILHPEDGSEEPEGQFTTGKKAKVNKKYCLSDKLWSYLQNYAKKHKAKGNGFGYGLVGPNDIARTLSARYYKDGSEILVSKGKTKNPRRLTPRECSRLMGFDTEEKLFKIPVSDTQAYKQFGNSVAVPVIAEVARIMKPHILSLQEWADSTNHQLRLFGT